MGIDSLPDVCVITPAFIECEERYEYIQRTCDSVQRQDASLVHIIVDDASPFGRFSKFLSDYARMENVLSIRRPINGGISAAINSGLYALLHECCSKKFFNVACLYNNIRYFTILHSDDILHKNDSITARLSCFDSKTVMVHSSMGILEQNNSVTVFGSPQVSDPTSIRRCFDEMLWHGCHISYPTMIWRIDFFKDYYAPLNENLCFGEDKLMALLSYKYAIENNLTIRYCSNHTIIKRLHSNSISGGSKRYDIGYRLSQDKIIYSRILHGQEYEDALQERVRHYKDRR